MVNLYICMGGQIMMCFYDVYTVMITRQVLFGMNIANMDPTIHQRLFGMSIVTMVVSIVHIVPGMNMLVILLL